MNRFELIYYDKTDWNYLPSIITMLVIYSFILLNIIMLILIMKIGKHETNRTGYTIGIGIISLMDDDSYLYPNLFMKIMTIFAFSLVCGCLVHQIQRNKNRLIRDVLDV